MSPDVEQCGPPLHSQRPDFEASYCVRAVGRDAHERAPQL